MNHNSCSCASKEIAMPISEANDAEQETSDLSPAQSFDKSEESKAAKTWANSDQRAKFFKFACILAFASLFCIAAVGVTLILMSSAQGSQKDESYNSQNKAVLIVKQAEEKARTDRSPEALAELEKARADSNDKSQSYISESAATKRWPDYWLAYWLGVSLLIAVTVAAIWYFRMESKRNFENSQLIKTTTKDDLKLVELWNANQEQLESYQRIVLNYAESTRQSTLISLGIGFLFVLALSIFAVVSASIPGSVVAGGAAVVTGFIAHATLKNAASSAKEVHLFFSHPLYVYRALAAERLIDDMPEPSQTEAKSVVIRYLMDASKFVREQPDQPPSNS